MKMKTDHNNSKLSIALVFGLVCASVLMMTGSASDAGQSRCASFVRKLGSTGRDDGNRIADLSSLPANA